MLSKFAFQEHQNNRETLPDTIGFKYIDRIVKILTSVSKSQSGDGDRRSSFDATFGVPKAGEPCGSSGMTANRPRCKHGDVGP